MIFVFFYWRHIRLIGFVLGNLQWSFVRVGCGLAISESQRSQHLAVLMIGGTVCGCGYQLEHEKILFSVAGSSNVEEEYKYRMLHFCEHLYL